VGSRAGLDRCGKSGLTGIRSPDRTARSQSLYRLRYPAHFQYEGLCIYKAHALCLKTLGKLADCAPAMVSARCCVGGGVCECAKPEY
jgi:hypothetical protein